MIKSHALVLFNVNIFFCQFVTMIDIDLNNLTHKYLLSVGIKSFIFCNLSSLKYRGVINKARLVKILIETNPNVYLFYSIILFTAIIFCIVD